MTITVSDIKLLASARMVDALDGGGRMTGNAVQDGAENNVFPDIGSVIDRAQGALQFRKLYPAVLNAGTDTLLGAHVLLDDLADDPTVSAVLMPSAGPNEEVSDLTAALNSAGENYGFRGASATTAEVADGASTVPLATTRAVLIPKTVLATAVAGDLVADGAQPTVVAWESAGRTVALAVSGFYLVPATSIGSGRLRPGSVTGTFTHASGAGTASSTADGMVTLTAPGYSRTATLDGYARSFYGSGSIAGDGLSALNLTAEVLVDVALPKQTLRYPVVDGQLTYVLALPPGTALNSESVAFTLATPLPIIGSVTSSAGGADVALGKETMVARTILELPTGAPAIVRPTVNYAYVNRATGVLTMVLPAPLKTGTDIVVTFAEGGNTTAVAPAALVSSGLFTGGSATATPGAGLELAAAAFDIVGGEAGLSLLQGVVRNASGTVRGSASAAGVLTIPGNDGRTITNWYAVQTDPNYGVTRVDAALPDSIDADTLVITGLTSLGASFSATANSAGVFATAHVTGTYNAATGALSLVFAASTKLRSLAYAATQQSPQTAFAPLWGLDAGSFAADGTVPVIRAGNIGVLRHTAAVAAATYANTNTVNVGRLNLSDVRVVGSNGVSIPNGWTVNLATGVLTVNDISGWAQPVTVRHTIEHAAMILSVPNSGAAVLGRAVTRAFPAGSVLSTALLLGDFQARAGASFSQESWTTVWSDTRIGSAIAPQYQQVSNPIAVTNAGAITERWAIIFTSSTTFRLIGESVGQIATGDINSNFSPINPATSVPYFTILATGWGSGWSNGNVLRLDTTGANGPVWAARAVIPSAPSSTPDSITIAVRGDIDA